MLEIIILWTAFSQLNEIAKDRGFSGVPYSIAFTVIYFFALMFGAFVGNVFFGLPAIAGAYLCAIPSAILAYYGFRAQIQSRPPTTDAPALNRTPRQRGTPIAFQCTRCGAMNQGFSTQRGGIVQCHACKKGTQVPTDAPPLPPALPSR